MKKDGKNTKQVDMHMHSNQSDGRNTVKELFFLVKKAGLEAAILTDHDRVKGLKEFIFSCKINNIDSMTGVEISSTDTTSHPQTIDVLGYGFNTETLLRYYNDILEYNLNVRIKYIKKVLDMYKKKRVMDFTLESLEAHFNLPAEVANKYWVIKARAERLRGRFATLKDAIEFSESELKRGGYYFVERENYVSTREVINAIRQSGGIAIWAHPTKTMEKLEKKYENSEKIFSAILDRMVYEGLDGLEVYTPYGDSRRKMLLGYNEKYGLIATGGSDYHGEYGLVESCCVGKEGISYEEFLKIKKAVSF